MATTYQYGSIKVTYTAWVAWQIVLSLYCRAWAGVDQRCHYHQRGFRCRFLRQYGNLLATSAQFCLLPFEEDYNVFHQTPSCQRRSTVSSANFSSIPVWVFTSRSFNSTARKKLNVSLYRVCLTASTSWAENNTSYWRWLCRPWFSAGFGPPSKKAVGTVEPGYRGCVQHDIWYGKWPVSSLLLSRTVCCLVLFSKVVANSQSCCLSSKDTFSIAISRS